MSKLMMQRFAVTLALLAMPGAFGADWPTWRYDSNRSAASPQELPLQLGLRWTIRLPKYRMAWPHEPRLQFDESYEPIVLGKYLFLGSPLDGSVTAYNTETGEVQWKFYTEGPARLAPAGWEGRIYVCSDDGYLYCLDAARGSLLWKFRGAPANRPDYRHLGNNRLISFWPARGGPVVADGTVYFGAGVWPTMGVFVHALDARSGKVVWSQNHLNYIPKVRIDHNNVNEAGLSPQGYLVVVGDKLIVANGRSMPAGLDRKTGKLAYYIQGYRRGASRVTARGKYIFVGNSGVLNTSDGREVGNRWVESGKDAPNGFDGRKFDLFEGPIHPYKMFAGCSARSVLVPGKTYDIHHGTVYAYDVDHAKRSLYEAKFADRVLHPARWDAPLLWKLPTEFAKGKPPTYSVIKAGNRLYGHIGRQLVAVSLPEGESKPRVVWHQALGEMPSSLLAADGKLFVATREGSLHCFSGEKKPPVNHKLASVPFPEVKDKWSTEAAELLKKSGVKDGYCILLGLGSGRLMDELLRQSSLRILAVDSDAARVNAAREKLVNAGLYDGRAEVFTGAPMEFQFPPYLASLVVSEDLNNAGGAAALSARWLFNILRPYGGTACFRLDGEASARLLGKLNAAKLPGAKVFRDARGILLRRPGALPGAAEWTHETADPARSYFSNDQRVKAPLGVLWYGDGEDYGFYKRKDYGTGVKPQVVGGRLFGFQIFSRMLHAVDVYTGRLLWKSKVDSFTRYASLPDGIYAAQGNTCVVYDPATGKLKHKFTYQYDKQKEQKLFVSDIRVSDTIILVAVAFQKSRSIGKGLWDSQLLVALDRPSGRPLWQRRAAERFNNNAIALSHRTVFCIDSLSPVKTEEKKRRGEPPKEAASALLALDARTGRELWTLSALHTFRQYGANNWLGLRSNDDWLAYARKDNLLLVGKNADMLALEAGTGKKLWEKKIGGGQPLIVRGDTFVNQAGYFYKTRTGELVKNKSFFRRGGCNYAVGNEYLIFLRDKSASFVDLLTEQKTYLRNLRSGCSNSFVMADGLLNAPCFSVGCICNYPIQTSFAMVHMGEAGAWVGGQ